MNLSLLLDTALSTLGALLSLGLLVPAPDAAARGALNDPPPRPPLLPWACAFAFPWPVTAADPPVFRPTTPPMRDELSDLAHCCSLGSTWAEDPFR